MSRKLSFPVTSSMINMYVTQVTCRLYSPVLPSFSPSINNLTVTTSVSGQYSLVYINGVSFFPNAITYVNFGSYTNIPITFYSSFNISFVVPLNAAAGNYNVVVANTYNGQFSPSVKHTYSGVVNYSNPVTYTLTAA